MVLFQYVLFVFYIKNVLILRVYILYTNLHHIQSVNLNMQILRKFVFPIKSKRPKIGFRTNSFLIPNTRRG